MNSNKLNALPFDILTPVLSHHLLPELNVISSERLPLTSQCRVSSPFPSEWFLKYDLGSPRILEIFARDL